VSAGHARLRHAVAACYIAVVGSIGAYGRNDQPVA
jgi:hypothetical protein